MTNPTGGLTETITVWHLLIGPAITAAVVSGLFALYNLLRREKFELKLERIRKEFADAIAVQKARLDNRAVYAAEDVARQLLGYDGWEQRTFGAIKRHLGGFEDDELRKILIGAGAVRLTPDNGEWWGLLEKNKHMLAQPNKTDEKPQADH